MLFLKKNTVLHKLLAQVWQGPGNNALARVIKIKTILPTGLTKGVKEALQKQTLNAAVERILASPPHKIPDDDTLQQHTNGWGNEGYSAPFDTFARSRGRCCL